MTPPSKCHHFHCMNEETEAERSDVTLYQGHTAELKLGLVYSI